MDVTQYERHIPPSVQIYHIIPYHITSYHVLHPTLRVQSKVGEDGGVLVELPRNYQALIHQLLGARRAEYDSLKGWLGPRRFQGAWCAMDAGQGRMVRAACVHCLGRAACVLLESAI
jgi:hypothetical protein